MKKLQKRYITSFTNRDYAKKNTQHTNNTIKKYINDIAAAGPKSNWPKAILTKSIDKNAVAFPGPPPVNTNGSV